MHILIVGAGSVGKVYGRHLALGGASVSFFVKEKYVERARAGFNFYPLNDRKHRRTPLVWKDYSVYTEGASLLPIKWDYVILAMSSPALRTGWLEGFLNFVPGAAILSLQPGMFDHDYLVARISEARLIESTIHIISYEAPLPASGRDEGKPSEGAKKHSGETMVEGTAYFIPPETYSALSGEANILGPLLSTFRRGKFSVKKVSDARKENIIANPVLTLIVLALQKSNWSFAKLLKSDLVSDVCRALPEAVAIQADKAGVSTPSTWFLKPATLKLILRLVPIFMPFDFEQYMKVHFTKVNNQMHEHLEQLIAHGKEMNASMKYLELYLKTIN